MMSYAFFVTGGYDKAQGGKATRRVTYYFPLLFVRGFNWTEPVGRAIIEEFIFFRGNIKCQIE